MLLDPLTNRWNDQFILYLLIFFKESMVVKEMFYHSWPSSPRLNSFLLTFFVSCSLFATIFLQVIHGRINLSINCNYNFFDIPLKSDQVANVILSGRFFPLELFHLTHTNTFQKFKFQILLANSERNNASRKIQYPPQHRSCGSVLWSVISISHDPEPILSNPNCICQCFLRIYMISK